MFEMDEDIHFHVIVQEKPSPRVEIKETGNVVKDGLHLIFGVRIEKKYHQWLRKQVVQKLPDVWADIPIVNSGGWEDVLDDSISNGSNGWLLPNSKKRDDVSHYEVSLVWDVHYDTDASVWRKKIAFDTLVHSRDSFLGKHYKELSPRYTNVPSFTLVKESMEEMVLETKKKDPAPPVEFIPVEMLRSIRTKEELELCLHGYLDSLASNQYDFREAYEYAMTLPVAYYGQGSYNKWIKVGFALRNIHTSLLIGWIAFSAQSSEFQYSDIPSMCERWAKFVYEPEKGVTKESLIYWSKNDASPESHNMVKENTIDFHLEQSIESITLDTINNPRKKNAKGCSDFDIACVLKQLKKGEYVACSIKTNEWYQFKQHRWTKNDSGTSLRKAISTDLRMLYYQKARVLSTRAMAFKTPEGEIDVEREEYKLIMGRANKVLDIAMALGSTKDKDNIMKEAREVFYDAEFMEKLDQNPYLLCMENGIIDFKAKCFRKGYPDDYISKCTHVKYSPLEPVHQPIVEEIKDYMQKLFPVPELCEYMWKHLSSIIIGMPALNQCLHYYTGIGQNGKSMLVKIMQQMLGDYAVDLDVNYFTNDRPKRGQSTPELFALIGARLAVTSEPSEGDKLNEGPMKQLTGGTDKMSCRPLYGQQITFTPQANSVIMANHFLDIKSRDHGTWRRIRVIDFLSYFTDNPVEGDKDKPYQFQKIASFETKFNLWTPVFLSMLIESAYLHQGEIGDIRSWPYVENSSNKYRRKKDYIAEFMELTLEKDVKGNIKKTEINLRFTDWYVAEFGGRSTGKTQELHTALDKLYGECKAGVGWNGVKLKPRNDYNDLGSIVSRDSEEFDLGEPIL